MEMEKRESNPKGIFDRKCDHKRVYAIALKTIRGTECKETHVIGSLKVSIQMWQLTAPETVVMSSLCVFKTYQSSYQKL
jgi:hypothetical protein